MHKGHLVGCGIGIAIALGFVAITGASSRSVELLVIVLVCPLAMVIAMKFLMGNAHGGAHHHPGADLPAERQQPARSEVRPG